ncbi:Ldh family oxidoreductase, partial [Bacillus paralicheniformis]
EKISQMVEELHDNPPAEGFDKVYYPGEIQIDVMKQYKKTGIPVTKEILDYLESDNIY